MKKNLLLKAQGVLSVLLFSISLNAQVDSALAAQYQAILDNYVLASGTRGISAAVILPGGQTWLGQAGDNGLGTPIETNTVFIGASNIKPMIAAVVLQLRDEGKLNLANHYVRYVDPINFIDTNITIQQLLYQVTGISNPTQPQLLLDEPIAHPAFFYPLGYQLQYLTAPAFAPGTDWQYSNANYILLARIIEQVSGRNIAEVMRSRVFTPLGLNHTYFGGYEPFSEPYAGLWWDIWGGTNFQNYSTMPLTGLMSFVAGAGNVVSTPGDLALFVRGLAHGEVVPPATLAEMLVPEPHSIGKAFGGAYGLGMILFQGALGELYFGHAGDLGHQSIAMHWPEQNFTIALAVNTNIAPFSGAFGPLYARTLQQVLATNGPATAGSFAVQCAPNPFRDAFEVLLPGTMATSNVSVALINANGQTVRTWQLDHPGTVVRLETGTLLPAGVYFLRVSHGNSVSTTRIVRAGQ